jgi:hypothetical protein
LETAARLTSFHYIKILRKKQVVISRTKVPETGHDALIICQMESWVGLLAMLRHAFSLELTVNQATRIIAFWCDI